MGEARRRRDPLAQCIYCGSKDSLTDEHVIPYGMSGDLVLRDASCPSCAKTTSALELRLLRGHWWPYRLVLGLKSRRPRDVVPPLKVAIEKADGTTVDALLPMEKQTVAMVFHLDPPSILKDDVCTEEPFAPRVSMKFLAPVDRVEVDGRLQLLGPKDKLTIPINYKAEDLCQFLAKVAHGYAISRRGPNACKKYFLPPIILGNLMGARTYIGEASSPFLEARLPGGGVNGLLDRINGKYLTVYIQLFRDKASPPPIYEVVVGSI
jgi:hypothetical protein